MADRNTTVRFSSNTSGLKQGVSEVINQLNQLNKALVDNQYKQKDCNKAIKEAQKEIDALNKKTKEGKELTEDDKKKIEQYNKTIEEQKLRLSQLRTEQTSLRQAISETSKGVVQSNKDWTVLKETLAHLTADTLKALSQKLLQVGKEVIQIGQNFSSSMSEVAAISGASAEQLRQLEQTAREYGATTKFSATESAQALKYMALAGWDADQSIEALGSVLDLAAAGGMDLARASDIVTDYITAFGLSADDAAHFADVMSYAMSNSNTNVTQLGEAYKNCAATAASMNFSLEEVTAALMTMANAGVKGGEAGTTLNTLMTRLATDAKGCATELESMGIRIYDENDNLKSLTEILELVTSAFDGMSDKQQAALSKAIAGTNQYSGLQTILKGLSDKAKASGQSFTDYAEALQKCDGSSKDMAKTMSNNLAGDLKTMQSAFEELALKVYEDGEGPLRDLVQMITKQGVPALESLINNLDVLVPIVVAAGSAFISYKAALGMTSIVQGVVSGFKSLTVATEGATAAQGALNVVQAANPMGLVLAAVGALTMGLTTYAMMAQNSAKATGELNGETENYLATVEQARQAAAEREEQTEADISSLNVLKDRYDDLRSSVKLTAAEKSELDTIAGELAKTLGKSIDDLKEKDGTYKDLTGDIDEYIKKLKEQIALEANKEELTAAYKSYNSALKAAADTREKIVQQEAKLIELEEEFGKKMEVAVGSEDENLQKGLRDTYYPLIEKEKEKLEKLNNTWAEYYVQGSNAARIIKETSEAMGSGNKATEEWESQLAALNGTTVGLSESQKILAQRTTSTGTAAEDTGTDAAKAAEELEALDKAAEEAAGSEASLEDQLTNANERLIQNQLQLRSTNEEMEEYRKKLHNFDFSEDGADEKFQEMMRAYQGTIDKAAELKTEQKKIRTEVQGLKDDIDKAARTASDAASSILSDASDVLGTIDKIKKEVSEQGNLTISTITSIAKKYPELSDKLDDYLAGLADEETIIKGLEKIYNDDVTAYNSYIVSKKLTQEGFLKTAAENSADLVNKYKEHYGIDLQNFTSVAAAKAAVQDRLNKALQDAYAKRNKLLTEYEPGIDMYGKEYVIYKGRRHERGTEVYRQYEKLQNEANAGINAAALDKKNFDEEAFAKQLSEDIMSSVKLVTADGLKKYTGSGPGSGTGSGSSSGGSSSSSSDRKTYQMNSWGIYGEGSTVLGAKLNWLDNGTGRGRISDATALKLLKQWKEDGKLTLAEVETLEKRIYDTRKRIDDQKNKGSSDKKIYDKKIYKQDAWGVYAEGDTLLSSRLNWLDRGAALGLSGFDDESRLKLLNKWRSEMKLTKNEEYELDKRILDLNKSITEEREKQQLEAEQETEELRKQGYELAQAAFETEINKKIEGYNKAAQAAKDEADAEIAAIDAVIKKRKEENDDQKRQDELDKINAQLKYKHLDDLSRRELERRKQDILNEQSVIDWERGKEAEKEGIRAEYDIIADNTQKAISGLQDSLGQFTDRLAQLLGTQTAAQQVAGNSTVQNFKIIQGSLSNDQFINEIVRKVKNDIYSG